MIETVTNSPKDWEDFWEREDNIEENKQINKRYVEDVINGNNVICKRESPLSD